MKTLFTCIGLITIFSQPLLANDHSKLDRLLDKYNQAYEKLGVDNNILKYEFYPTTNARLIQEKLKIRNIQRLSINQYFGPIKHCVFMQKGAYGKHISNTNSNRLSKTFLKELIRGWETTPRLYLIRKYNLDYVNNDCSLLIVAPSARKSVMIQGTSSS